MERSRETRTAVNASDSSQLFWNDKTFRICIVVEGIHLHLRLSEKNIIMATPLCKELDVEFSRRLA